MNADLPKPAVGIITALPLEYAAMEAMLKSPIKIQVPGDGAGRLYSHGQINAADGSEHSVILTLADQGNNIAAIRATRMLNQFPSVKIIVMMGIAGGVPAPNKPEHHVRLGDIVVSNKKGIIQYDFKKEHSDAEEVNCSPIAPSAALLDSVRLLQAGELAGRYPWEAHISAGLKQLKWKRPPKKTDVLVDSIDPSVTLPHPRDPSRRGANPRLFVAPIAAANTLLKNPSKRDLLGVVFGVKAIEMEGSGIADATWSIERGYLVVRGVCDYCDSKKTDLWQNYAAVVAAAFTRALFESCANLANSPTLADEPPPSTVGVPQHKAARLEETISLYLSKCYMEDQFARLDQAGEADADRSTLLQRVFVDLELKPRSGQQHLASKLKLNSSRTIAFRRSLLQQGGKISALDCFLGEPWAMIVIIGGPGHGKSTLGQYLAQVHRAAWLKRETEHYLEGNELGPRNKPRVLKPQKPRLVFRIVLKYYAQWLATRLPKDSVKRQPLVLEAYMAEQVAEKSGRDGEVTGRDIQDLLRTHPVLLILDGLDEVTETELRRNVLVNVEGFLDRAKHMDSDLRVIATSRPTEYSGDFDPAEFWHLELQPMNAEKVRAYANKWVLVKVPVEDDRKRILDTLEDCLKEEHTKLLLTTPLQVTIVLLIIQSGGRPPSLREALFQEYWNTILRREKAKGKGVIRSDDQTLFDLHAYLGYVLHQRAAGENVRSLLPTDDFQRVIHDFLREKDRISGEDAVRDRASQLVREATFRLVLLVEPEPGLFGFELRSLQEFFAAVYLAQTARDTEQRFARLRAIARSAHWRNVALFFAGRVVRTFSGEAANILEIVCRPIDREPRDRYLRRGAWLSLDIAADSCFAGNRDLQWSAVEFGLTVCETVVASKLNDRVLESLRRLPPDDRDDILRRLLDEQLPNLPNFALPLLLSLYGEMFGANDVFLAGLERFESKGSFATRQRAWNLAFRYGYDETWLAARLGKDWKLWSQDNRLLYFVIWFQEQPRHFEAVLRQWNPSQKTVEQAIQVLATDAWRLSLRAEASPATELSIRTPVDQLIVFLQASAFLSYQEPSVAKGASLITVAGSGTEIGFIELTKQRQQSEFVSTLLSHITTLLAQDGLVTPLRITLWVLLLKLSDPTIEMASDFLTELAALPKNDENNHQTLLRPLSARWPLLALAGELTLKKDIETASRVKKWLSADEQIWVAKELRSAVQTIAQRTKSPSAWEWVGLRLHTGSAENIPEIEDLAARVGVTPGPLVRAHITSYSAEREKYSPEIVQWLVSEIRHTLRAAPDEVSHFWAALRADWTLKGDAIEAAYHLLLNLVEATAIRSDYWPITILLFIKVFGADAVEPETLSMFLSTLGRAKATSEVKLWLDRGTHVLSRQQCEKLVRLAKSSAPAVRTGAITLLTIIIDSMHLWSRHLGESVPPAFDLVIEWRMAWKLTLDKHPTTRRRGITLLSMSDFPISEAERRGDLLKAIDRTTDDDEIESWKMFVSGFRVRNDLEGWTQFLETALGKAENQNPLIIQAVMDRYADLVGASTVDFASESSELGLSLR